MLINIFSRTKYQNMKKYFEETFYIETKRPKYRLRKGEKKRKKVTFFLGELDIIFKRIYPVI